MQNGASRSPSLEFTNCVFPLADATEERFAIDGTVGRGEIVLVVTEDRLHDHALTSAICGLLPPLTGST